MSLVFDMWVLVSDSRVTCLCWVPVKMRALGRSGMKPFPLFPTGSRSDSGRSCLVDTIGLWFPISLPDPILNYDIRDEDVEQQMWGM